VPKVISGDYSIDMNLQCNTLLKFGKDSSKIPEAKNIAKQLYNDALKSDPGFNEVVVSFSCDTSNWKYKDLIFVYKCDSLKIIR
jgi:hypothetical protein